ncbi:hypothetical protein L1887_04646 [Cichorium endivia]|nr:hypothetical protein L1887_04646 [Cichorium endivia]
MVHDDGYESKFIMDIVNVIRRKLDYKALYIEEKLVGIKDDVAEIESWLQDPSPNAVILLIDGMGGIGKTTIAKCIYNSNSGNYDGSCFLSDINETSNRPGGLLRLQSQLLSTILKSKKEETIWNDYEGTVKVTNAISNKKDSIEVLQDQSGTEKVEGLMLVMPKMKEAQSTRSLKQYFGKRIHGNNANFEIGALENMKNLMLLHLNYVTFSGKCKKLPRKLRLLRWHGCTLKSIPSESCLEKLVVLDMSHSKLKRVWDDFKFIGSLKILNLSYSVELIKTPDFRGLPSLESLILKGCSSLIKVDRSIANLKELVLLDLTDCTNIREFPCFPTSLVSLQMSGCQVLGLIQSLNSVPSFSLLRQMNLSDCNLFDNSFPSDWSSLVSLDVLTLDGNNITSLPKCIQTLPTIRELILQYCSTIQSILDLPESLTVLYACGNESLEKVQLTQNHLITVFHLFCEKLCEIEGRYKVRSIDKVERKIIRYMGLESNARDGLMELGLKVLHEFGIFSTCVSGKLIPSRFMYKERGPQISFDVPWHDGSFRIIGFNMCVILSQPSPGYDFLNLVIEVYNKTKDLFWIYIQEQQRILKNTENYAWLSVWRCGNLLEAGDEISIHIRNQEVGFIKNIGIIWCGFSQPVEECRINLLYGVDEQLDEETKEACDVSAFDQISWTDRMDTNISDYVYSGGMYEFTNCYWGPQEIKAKGELILHQTTNKCALSYEP